MKESQKTSQLRREILAIILFTLSLVILLSLISYNSDDPSFFLYDTEPQKIHNLLGIVGSYISDLMLQVFGL
ncbi:MAG: DNA translocase FtsK 4TM domain-containing protein, partial [Deltaproteobacteria bacterium]|nr:DNA translocase FtsK 4TM domain-containing protein [Deltaproteobacteria bacterium]